VLGDFLYCDQPICLAILKAGFNLILVCLPKSHQTLYEWIDFLAAGGQVQNRQCRRWTGKEHETDTYRFVNDVPVRDGEEALNVNWCEITTCTTDGTIIYQNAFATHHLITETNVVEIVAEHDGKRKTKITTLFTLRISS